jgi:hypothetical protein
MGLIVLHGKDSKMGRAIKICIGLHMHSSVTARHFFTCTNNAKNAVCKLYYSLSRYLFRQCSFVVVVVFLLPAAWYL